MFTPPADWNRVPTKSQAIFPLFSNRGCTSHQPDKRNWSKQGGSGFVVAVLPPPTLKARFWNNWVTDRKQNERAPNDQCSEQDSQRIPLAAQGGGEGNQVQSLSVYKAFLYIIMASSMDSRCLRGSAGNQTKPPSTQQTRPGLTIATLRNIGYFLFKNSKLQ